jgi:hypothetical protein
MLSPQNEQERVNFLKSKYTQDQMRPYIWDKKVDKLKMRFATI